MKHIPVKALLVIDDRHLRKAAFAQAEKILKKIDRLEKNFESFDRDDQRLFSSWFELTFSGDKKQLAELNEEYKRLAIFHNWIFAVSQRRGFSAAEAYAFLRAEEEAYLNGSDAKRAKIDETRRKRDEYIRAEIEKEFSYDDSKIEWDFKDSRYEHEDDFRRARADRAESSEDELSEDELPASVQRQAAADQEQLKLTYHRIVRSLHPDRRGEAGAQPAWQKQIWHRAQEAYGRKDTLELEKLYRLLLIRGRSFNELKISEILESHFWLGEELESLKQQAKQFRRFPAWGFSQRTSYEPLVRKLEKPLRAEFDELKGKIEELKMQHAYLSRIASARRRS